MIKYLVLEFISLTTEKKINGYNKSTKEDWTFKINNKYLNLVLIEKKRC